MSGRQESYDATTSTRRRRRDVPSEWTVIEIDELRELRRSAGGTGFDTPTAQEIAEPLRSVNRCRLCPAEGVGMLLHADPDNSDPRRCICGGCQGAANARRAGIEPRNGGAR